MAKIKTERVKTTANSSRPRTPRIRAAHPTEQDIARHAYDLYLSRGGESGHDVEDWLQAERELDIDPEC